MVYRGSSGCPVIIVFRTLASSRQPRSLLRQRVEAVLHRLAQVDDSTGGLPGVMLELVAAPARTELSPGPRRGVALRSSAPRGDARSRLVTCGPLLGGQTRAVP